MRNLIKVIESMLLAIPSSEEALIADLENVKSSTEYSAPELMGLRWETAADILEDSFPEKIEDFNDWQKKVANIWLDK